MHPALKSSTRVLSHRRGSVGRRAEISLTEPNFKAINLFDNFFILFKSLDFGWHKGGRTCKPAKGNDSRDVLFPARNAIKLSFVQQ